MKNKIFIIGTITNTIPESFVQIEKNLKKDFTCISTYDENTEGLEKMNWVYEKIDNSDLVIAIFPQISFGTSFELGYATAKNKKVILISSEYMLETLNKHPVICSKNITPVSFISYENIKKIVSNLIQN